MKIVHRIALRASESQRKELEALGVVTPPGDILPGERDAFVAFDVTEDHPNWPSLRRLFDQWKVPDNVRTVFSKSEIKAADWLKLTSEWYHGYPQPDDGHFGYLGVTYDLSDYCKKCGIGARQKAPFQMEGEPRWGRNGILQLNWVFDEYFVTPEVWTKVFKAHGVRSRPVTDTTGSELRSVLQLVVEEEVDLHTEGLATEACAICGRIKYLPVTRGPFPALVTRPAREIARTKEHFGSGGRAFRAILVSKALAHALNSEAVRGVSLRPVAKRTDGH
ncbi:MAG TPA: hypothetical protein VH913_11310 [Hyphomicrobiaceae bacterium]|jgi:hypothetical protein